MKTQFDHNQRVVSLANLEAMCDRVSGTCHRYQVVKVTTNRVHVEYSNPDEYANDRPMLAVLPCWPADFNDKDNRAVALTILRVVGDSWDGEGWQAFDTVFDCRPLYRHCADASAPWQTTYEILVEHYPQFKVTRACPVNDSSPNRYHVRGELFESWDDATDYATGLMQELRKSEDLRKVVRVNGGEHA